MENDIEKRSGIDRDGNDSLLLKTINYKIEHINNKIDDTDDKMERIEKLLMGNGKVGVAEMARRSFEWMQTQIDSRQGLLDWAFRAVLLILLTFVAAKVGLK